MSQVIPEGVKSNGHVPVYFFPEGAITDLGSVSVAQATDDAVVKLDCYFTEGNPVVNKNSETREVRRMCLKAAATKPGGETYTIELTGVYDGQNKTPAQNELYNTLKKGVKGTVGIGWGKDSEDALASSDVLDLIRGEVGSVTKNTPVWDEDLTVTISWLGESWEEDVAISA